MSAVASSFGSSSAIAARERDDAEVGERPLAAAPTAAARRAARRRDCRPARGRLRTGRRRSGTGGRAGRRRRSGPRAIVASTSSAARWPMRALIVVRRSTSSMSSAICSRRASCTPDLEVEERVEGRSVVEVGERVAFGHRVGLAELERGLERRSADAEHVLERRDVDLAEAAIRRARQHREHPRVGRRVHQRHREAAADRSWRRWRVVAVEGHLDGARAAVVRDAEAADLVRPPPARDRPSRGSARLRAHDRDGRVGGGLLASELEDADDARVVRGSRAPCSRAGAPEIAAVIRAGSVWLSASLSVCANSARR